MVEPDPRLAGALRRALLGWGHLSTTAPCTIDGLASTVRQTPDLVLLDSACGHEEMDQFVAAIGALGTRTPPIVLMSEEPTAPIWQVVGFIRKPVDLAALERVVAAFASDLGAAHAP